MPKLETQRLLLNPFRTDELDELHQLFISPFIRKYLWDDLILSKEQTKETLEQSLTHFQQDRWGLWKIQEKGREEIIGFTGLWYFFEEAQPQLLYALAEEHTGKGLASEAALEIIRYAWEKLGYNYLIASMDEEHKVSQKLAKRIGMKFVENRLEEGKATLAQCFDLL